MVALTKVGKEGITGISNSSNATAITIDSSENVGIGTATPASYDGEADNLVIASSGHTGVTIASTGSDQRTNLYFSDGTSSTAPYIGGFSYNHSDNSLLVRTSGAERMRLDTSGNLMIGTTDSTYNSIGAAAALTSFNNGVRFGANFGASTTGSQYAVVFSNPNGQIGGVNVNGSATSYVTSSDYRLKTAVTYDWDATTRLKQLKPARFKWIVDGDDAVEVDGFLAHEAATVCPESVTGTKDEVEVWKNGEELPDGVSVGDNKLDKDGNTIPVMQAIDQAKLVPLLCKTILELEARITALENA